MRVRRIDALAIAAFIAVCEMVGAAIPAWYAALRKPSLTPPDWVFGPVWTMLFVVMGVAAFLLWRVGWSLPTCVTS